MPTLVAMDGAPSTTNGAAAATTALKKGCTTGRTEGDAER
jgi:hypothetical protein